MSTPASLHPCDDCGRMFDIDDLDPVLLDEHGAEASDEIYCRACWPRHKRISYDQYRSNRV